VKGFSSGPTVVKSFTNVGRQLAPLSPEEFASFIASERPKWEKGVKASGNHID